MAIDDLFGFDEAKYRSKVANWEAAHLRKSEVVKLRQENGAVASGLGGVFLAPMTGGLSLLGSAYGARRYSIASQKLKIIQEELDTRGLPRHTLTDRDEVIPVLSSMVGLGVGFGVGLDAAAGAAGDHIAGTAAQQAAAAPSGVAGHHLTSSAETFIGSHAAQVAARQGMQRGLSMTFCETVNTPGYTSQTLTKNRTALSRTSAYETSETAKTKASTGDQTAKSLSISIHQYLDVVSQYTLGGEHLKTWEENFENSRQRYEALYELDRLTSRAVQSELGQWVWEKFYFRTPCRLQGDCRCDLDRYAKCFATGKGLRDLNSDWGKKAREINGKLDAWGHYLRRWLRIVSRVSTYPSRCQIWAYGLMLIRCHF